MANARHLLEVAGLVAEFRTARGLVRAVDGASFVLDAGETLAIVGESGSGKTATALAMLRLLPDPPGRIVGGLVLLEGTDLLELPPESLTDVRGARVAMVFQEPATALNPVMTVGAQVAEAVLAHRAAGRAELRRAVLEALDEAGIPTPQDRLGQYPHQLSGGLKQRVMIAMALAAKPAVLVADEPTTALDVTVQAHILDLLAYLQARFGLALLLITHDLGVVARIAGRVAVMYAGRIVETATAERFFRGPAHPYSVGLLDAARLAEASGGSGPGLRGRLKVIAGSVPDPLDLPRGCRFAPRCERRLKAGGGRLVKRCLEVAPSPVLVAPGHEVACWLASADHREGAP